MIRFHNLRCLLCLRENVVPIQCVKYGKKFFDYSTGIRKYSAFELTKNLLQRETVSQEAVKSFERDKDFEDEIQNESSKENDKKFDEDDEYEEIFQDISKGDEDMYYKLKYMKWHLTSLLEQEYVNIKLSRKQWNELSQESLRSGNKTINFMVLNAKKKMMAGLKVYLLEDLPAFNDDLSNIKRGILLNYRDSLQKKAFLRRAFAAYLHSPEVIIDFSYEEYMTSCEIRLLCKQVANMISLNMAHPNPYKLVFCNFDKNSRTGSCIERFVPNIYSNQIPIDIYEGSFLDLFPKNEMVYLTPHCKTDLKNVQLDKRYIIGAFVDKTITHPISLEKAKRYHLSMAKFPVDQYLVWGIGKKTFTLNQCLQHLLDARYYDNDWNTVFKTVPKRFLLSPEERIRRKRIREKDRSCVHPVVFS